MSKKWLNAALSRADEVLSRRAMARLLSTFLCAVVIVIRPFSRLGGDYGFLVLTAKELVFSAQPDLAQHLEATILNVTGALIGIGLSALGMFLSTLLGEESTSGRAMKAFWLVFVVFVASGLKSKLPRLALSARICMFVACFMLTIKFEGSSEILPNCGNFLWIILSAAAISFFSCSLLLEWSSAAFAQSIVTCFALLRKSLVNILNGTKHDQITRKTLFAKSIALNATYQQASFEIRVGRLSVKATKPLIGAVEFLRRELYWGSAYTPSITLSENEICTDLRASIVELGGVLSEAMQVAEDTVHVCYLPSSLIHPSDKVNIEPIASAMTKLSTTDREVRARLQGAFNHHNVLLDLSGDGDESSRELLDTCLLVVSLLQMSGETARALQASQHLALQHNESQTRLWFPHFSMAWLGVPPRHVLLDSTTNAGGDESFKPAYTLSAVEARQGVREAQASASREKALTRARYFLNLPYRIHEAWSGPTLLPSRIALSGMLQSIRKSSHARHALKNAAGVAALSFPAFLPHGSAGRTWFSSVHGQWMVITYFWILETTTGATWRSGYLRISGTIIGAVYAYITWLICHVNPYGLVALLTLSDIPVSWFILHTQYPPLGIVAAITLPPIALSDYILPLDQEPIALIALDRGLMIGAGIIAALLVNSFIFPQHARVIFLRDVSRVLSLLSSYYLELSRETVGDGANLLGHTSRRVLATELEIRALLHRLGTLLAVMNDELSLSPKPIGRYRKAHALLQATFDLLIGLRRVREHIPKKETVHDVVQERVELMSCVCLSLYAAEHAFRSRQPLPQFIPSARHALRALQHRIRHNQTASSSTIPSGPSLPLVHALAEQELMEKIVDKLEELLDLGRDLFGSAAWLDSTPSRAGTRPGSPEDEETHELVWYSTVSSRV